MCESEALVSSSCLCKSSLCASVRAASCHCPLHACCHCTAPLRGLPRATTATPRDSEGGALMGGPLGTLQVPREGPIRNLKFSTGSQFPVPRGKTWIIQVLGVGAGSDNKNLDYPSFAACVDAPCRPAGAGRGRSKLGLSKFLWGPVGFKLINRGQHTRTNCNSGGYCGCAEPPGRSWPARGTSNAPCGRCAPPRARCRCPP